MVLSSNGPGEKHGSNPSGVTLLLVVVVMIVFAGARSVTMYSLERVHAQPECQYYLLAREQTKATDLLFQLFNLFFP